MASNFLSQMQKFNIDTKEKLDEVGLRAKLAVGNYLVSRTRIAKPETWNPPRTDHIPGAMRGNWRVGGTYPFEPERRNRTLKIRAEEAAKITPIGLTVFTNTTPYLLVYEEKDAMIARTIAAIDQIVTQAIMEVGSRG